MEHKQSTGTHSMMRSEPMPEISGLLTEEKKKKFAVMKLEMKKKFMEMKISNMQKMLELKKKAIADFKQVQEMLEQGK